MVAGEMRQLTGRLGVKRAKRWLDYSTRVANIYTNTDRVFSDLLHFSWPYGDQGFSFDLGGKLRGGDLDGQSFMAEVKTYRKEMDLPTEYRKFIAECYVAFLVNPDRCDHLMWISWSPFQAQSWDRHRRPDSLRKHLLHRDNLFRVLGAESESEGREKIDEQVIFELTRRIWLVTLCDEQEGLLILGDHYDRLMTFMRVEERHE